MCVNVKSFIIKLCIFWHIYVSLLSQNKLKCIFFMFIGYCSLWAGGRLLQRRGVHQVLDKSDFLICLRIYLVIQTISNVVEQPRSEMNALLLLNEINLF